MAAATALILLPGCDLGGGGGGGPADRPRPPGPAFHPAEHPDLVAYGEQLYRQWGCRLCHGDAGKGGVANPNSETGGKIVGLTLVKEGYDAKALHERLRDGVPEVGRKGGKGPTPPLRMPAFGRWLSDEQIDALGAYIFGLYPADRAKKADDWDDEDEDEEDTALPGPVSPSVAPTPGVAPAAEQGSPNRQGARE